MTAATMYVSPALCAELCVEDGWCLIYRPYHPNENNRPPNLDILPRTVGEFLDMPEYQSGAWAFDVGRGWPPDPPCLQWDVCERCWKYIDVRSLEPKP